VIPNVFQFLTTWFLSSRCFELNFPTLVLQQKFNISSTQFPFFPKHKTYVCVVFLFLPFFFGLFYPHCFRSTLQSCGKHLCVFAMISIFFFFLLWFLENKGCQMTFLRPSIFCSDFICNFCGIHCKMRLQ